MGVKRQGKIRQTRTEFQKAFDDKPGLIQETSWHDVLPELLHVSVALQEFSYEEVKKDFEKISDFVRSRHQFNRPFHFNLTHTLKIIKTDPEVYKFIEKTCFKTAIQHIINLYFDLFELDEIRDAEMNPKLLLVGFAKALDGRSETSILSKYIMIEYDQKDKPSFKHFLNVNTKEEVLQSTSEVMSMFPVAIGLSENLDSELCYHIWMSNYFLIPPIFRPDSAIDEEGIYNEFEIDKLKDSLSKLFEEFRKINFLFIYPRGVAEVQMGFMSRVFNLSVDTVEMVKTHKGEIAELILRSVLETFINAAWLMHKNDPNLYRRFREFSVGKDKFMAEKLAKSVPEGVFKEQAKKIKADAAKVEGMRSEFVAFEHGDVFEISIAKMAEELWGNDEMSWYFPYKRMSETTHGHWRVIAKYHIAKSFNPMHNGLYFYNQNPNRFSGMTPAFTAIQVSLELMILMLDDINDESLKELQDKMIGFRKEVSEGYLSYYKKYILKE